MYPQPMFPSRNKENNVYPCKPQFYYIKVGFKGVKIRYIFVIVFVELGMILKEKTKKNKKKHKIV